MNNKLIILVLSFMIVISCGRKAAPTYDKEDEKKVFKSEKKN
tara:strand:+ start:293 stop:418 length:126 start_codon:yes stop_codon:yes gene_type:complete